LKQSIIAKDNASINTNETNTIPKQKRHHTKTHHVGKNRRNTAGRNSNSIYDEEDDLGHRNNNIYTVFKGVKNKLSEKFNNLKDKIRNLKHKV
jgi:hypothetical protein